MSIVDFWIEFIWDWCSLEYQGTKLSTGLLGKGRRPYNAHRWACCRLRLKCDGDAQKPDFVLRLNGRVHLNRRGASVQSTTGSRGVRISGSNAGYTMFRGSVKSSGYQLHSPVTPSLPLLCVTVCHHISTDSACFRCSNLCVMETTVCITPGHRPYCTVQHLHGGNLTAQFAVGFVDDVVTRLTFHSYLLYDADKKRRV